MVVERFVTQFDGCTYKPGGFNCTCACEAMWLYRASQGRIVVSSCQCRKESGDTTGGTNLRDMLGVSIKHGITGGMLYQPVAIDFVFEKVRGGRHGSHLDVSYAPLAGTPYDVFRGNFRENHDLFLSGPGKTAGTIRVGDPGGKVFHDVPEYLLRTAAGRLDLGNGETINSEHGSGKCYAYMTPGDPVVHVWYPTYIGPPPAAATFATAFKPGAYSRYDSIGRKIGTFTTQKGFTAYGNGRRKVGARMIGHLITGSRLFYVDVHSGSAYYSR